MKKILNEWRRFVITEAIEKTNLEKKIEAEWPHKYNEVLADVKRKTVSIFESSLFVLAIAFSNSKSPLFRTPLTIKFASTFLQKSIVSPL